MLHIIICEDDSSHRKLMEKVVREQVASDKQKMKLVLSTGNPDKVLAYLSEHSDKHSLYFLDVDLGHEQNGIELGAKIRQADPLAKIVFVTTHDEMAFLTFTHKVRAMDYIIKSSARDISSNMVECIKKAHRFYREELENQTKFFKLNTGGQILNISHDDILFFESDPGAPNKVIVHTETGPIAYRGLLRDAANLGPEFFQCHKCNVVNITKIKRIDKIKFEVEMTNGEVARVGIKKLTELIRRQSAG